ncbi:hypothetical protein CANMA_000416 [Candida margitis]|uniref:uncharacterized protein n=1 Tax=Candida margitis TaxID=1775924 RepID=UPI002226D3ED|nr:uncharacterized protein CANMA_000416 [Candida margitis]KAI5970507.1 hypothetical protein CANMA_000416 [Candida margitis]
MDALTTIIDTEAENPYATFPSVARTASINGFADRIYDQLPECAKACMFESTGSTPCPYWDTGCLCVMPQFGGAIGQCVADNCQGDAIGSVEYLATSICSSAGVWDPYWFIPESVSEALASAAAVVVEAETTVASTEETAATNEAQEGSSVDTGAEQPVETGEAEEEQVTEEQAEEEQSGEEQAPEEQPVETGAPEEEQAIEEQVGEESTTEGEAEITEAPNEEEGVANEEGEAEAGEELSTSIDAGSNAIGAEEASSIASELANGGVAKGVAMGGIIAALAALI